jgi:hypothetical protein
LVPAAHSPPAKIKGQSQVLTRFSASWCSKTNRNYPLDVSIDEN